MCEELKDGYVKCPVSSCTEPINREEDMVKSRFDNNVYICESCREDGN